MLKEELNIKDGLSPNGYVVIEDKDGHIIFKGHNMVVKEGRQIVMSKMLKNLSDNKKINIDSNILSDSYDFYGIYLSSKTDETTFEADINSIGENGKASITGSYFKEFGADNTGISKNNISIDLDSLCISFKVNFSTDSSNTTKTTLNSLGIVMKDSSNHLKLFSRICFDTIPLQLGSSYTLTYYLYF